LVKELVKAVQVVVLMKEVEAHAWQTVASAVPVCPQAAQPTTAVPVEATVKQAVQAPLAGVA
jgi:hypothetical protein